MWNRAASTGASLVAMVQKRRHQLPIRTWNFRLGRQPVPSSVQHAIEWVSFTSRTRSSRLRKSRFQSRWSPSLFREDHWNFGMLKQEMSEPKSQHQSTERDNTWFQRSTSCSSHQMAAGWCTTLRAFSTLLMYPNSPSHRLWLRRNEDAYEAGAGTSESASRSCLTQGATPGIGQQQAASLTMSSCLPDPKRSEFQLPSWIVRMPEAEV